MVSLCFTTVIILLLELYCYYMVYKYPIMWSGYEFHLVVIHIEVTIIVYYYYM